MTTVIDHASGRRARGALYSSRAAAEAAHKRRRSPDACLLSPGAFGPAGATMWAGPEPGEWFVGRFMEAAPPEPPGPAWSWAAFWRAIFG